MIIDILLIKNFFQEQLGLLLEVPHNTVVVLWADQFPEVFEYVVTPSWIKAILLTLKTLQLEEQR